VQFTVVAHPVTVAPDVDDVAVWSNSAFPDEGSPLTLGAPSFLGVERALDAVMEAV
jgi:hypothetical protein